MLIPRQGREARPASPRWNVLKTLFQTAIFWSVFLLLIPQALYQLEARIGLDTWRFGGTFAHGVGCVLFLLGGTLGLTSGMVMAIQGEGTPLPTDCPRALVVRGPYRYLRNPMAVAGLGQGVAVGIYLGSLVIIAYALLGGPVWNYLVRPWEEADLEHRFGASYQHYCSQVRCWLPLLAGYTPPAELLSKDT